MIRQKLFLKLIALILCITSSFSLLITFSGCEKSTSSSQQNENDYNEITDEQFIYLKAGIPVPVEEFDYSDLYIRYMSNGMQINASVDKSFISQEDQNKLMTAGVHTITYYFNGKALTTIVTLISTQSGNITDVSVLYTKAGQTVYVNEFSYSYIKINYILDGVEKSQNATTAMISSEDQAKLKTSGTHTITIVFNGQSYPVVITLSKKDASGEESDSLTYNGTVKPSNYYSGIDNLSGLALKAELREIISKVTKRTSYEDLKSYLCKTDLVVGKTNKILTIYTRKEVNAVWDGADTWNREHVWPQSKGWFKTSGAGSDLHHLRPELTNENSRRGNKPFTDQNKSGYYTVPAVARGDVARILFYLLVRYSESDSYNVSVVASMDMLLRWNKEDPVDEWELQRNQKTQDLQGNRNPFIDCEELADRIWGKAA